MHCRKKQLVMQLRIDQLNSSLKKGLAPIYWVSGDEYLLVDEACATIRAAVQTAGYHERELYYVENSFKWSTLSESANALSLFAEKKLIELRLASTKLNDKGKALSDYCQSPPQDTILLIISPKLESSVKRTKWYTTIEKSGVSIPIWPINNSQLPRWISQRLSQNHITATQEAIQTLARLVEGNLLAAAQEIEKLTLFYQGRPLEPADIAAAVSNHARYDVFYLVDRALSGNAIDAVRAINGLQQEAAEPTLVLWSLSREIRTLYEIKQLTAQGEQLDSLLAKHRIWDKRKPLVRSALHRLSLEELASLVQLCGIIDQAIKGLNHHSPWQQLTTLVCTLAGYPLVHDSGIMQK